MSIYDKSTKALMHDFATEKLSPAKFFGREDAVHWFSERYPKINPMTVRMHVNGMSINSPQRKHHPTIRPGSGHDLFYKIGPNQFRLWDSVKDEAPFYAGSLKAVADSEDEEDNSEELDGPSSVSDLAAREFALEADLRNYICRNLNVVEPGLRLYEDEGLTGIEFPVSGRRIDILCVDINDDFLVIELKVSRGYDRTIGQLLRYMAWVKENMAAGKKVRGLIVASNITNDLKLAASLIPQVNLVEYQLAFSLTRV